MEAVIVLHGPPATGKSQICEHIRKKVPGATRISLDRGWGVGEIRYRAGKERYMDLTQAQSPILVIELRRGQSFSEVLQSLGIRTMYEQKNQLFTFPQIQDFMEVCIDTSIRDYDDVARKIIGLAGAGYP